MHESTHACLYMVYTLTIRLVPINMYSLCMVYTLTIQLVPINNMWYYTVCHFTIFFSTQFVFWDLPMLTEVTPVLTVTVIQYYIIWIFTSILSPFLNERLGCITLYYHKHADIFTHISLCRHTRVSQRQTLSSYTQQLMKPIFLVTDHVLLKMKVENVCFIYKSTASLNIFQLYTDRSMYALGHKRIKYGTPLLESVYLEVKL